jgi:hypothetical protein
VKIDRKLNLVIPLEMDDGTTVYVHSTPIATEVFDQHFEVIAQVWNELMSGGYGAVSGPRVAAKLMRKLAVAAGVWDGPMGIDAQVMNEVRRLTSVIMPRGSETPMLLLPDAVKKGVLSKEDQDVLENHLVFFTAASSMLRGQQRTATIGVMASVWGALTTSLGSTDFAHSLPTSSETDSSGEKATA